MFKTVLITLLFGAAIAFDWKDYPDRDAFFLAQIHNGSILEPSKEVYEKIHKDLEEIRKSFPAVAHIHHIPDLEPGKTICGKESLNLEKLNNSKYGPITVEDIGHDDYLITYTRPYNDFFLGSILVKEFRKHVEGLSTCGSVKTLAHRYNIKLSDLDGLIDPSKSNPSYLFNQNSVNCFVYCRKQHMWHFVKKDGKFVLKSESEIDLDKRTTLAIHSTTTKF